VPKEQEIDDLQGILARDHGPAILSWIIAGAVEFAKGGSLREPESVISATAEYASEQDTVQRFVSEMCNLSDSDVVRTEVGVLAASYARWCEELGEEPVSGKRLSMDLSNRYGVRSGRDNRRRWYLGIGLENTAPSFMRGALGQSNLSQPEPWDSGR
jgi:putative DNA primase/helicase